LIYLDKHVVVWLYAGMTGSFNHSTKELMNAQPMTICPAVRLELQHLYEIQRVTEQADAIVADLATRIGLSVCDKAFNDVITQAMALSRTRDPFDRLIVANAGLGDDILITKDQRMLDHYPLARW